MGLIGKVKDFLGVDIKVDKYALSASGGLA